MNVMSRAIANKAKSVSSVSLTTPSLERRRLRAYAILIVLDAMLLIGSAAFAGIVYEGVWWPRANVMAAEAMLPIFLTVALYNQSYSGGALADWKFATRQVLIALLIAAALLNFVAFYTKSNAEFSRASVTLGLGIAALGLILVRRLVPVFVRHFWAGRTVNRLVIDDGGPEFRHPKSDVISSDCFGIDARLDDPLMRDRLGRLLQNRDKVIVTCPAERSRAWATLLKSTGVYGEIVSDRLDLIGVKQINRYEGGRHTALVVSTGPLALRSRASKRLFDMAVAALALAVLGPLMLFIALLIKVQDGGPVLFVQRRLGRGNTLFGMLKFRSMSVSKCDANGACSTKRRDKRVTRFGSFIRRTSIDELPQLLNVLRGDMSIVGPRPHALGSRANSKLFWEVDAQYWHRHCLKPGLTGLAQVRGHRGATEREKDLTDRLESDLEYISDWSLLRDLQIVIRTFRVLRHEKAY